MILDDTRDDMHKHSWNRPSSVGGGGGAVINQQLQGKLVSTQKGSLNNGLKFK